MKKLLLITVGLLILTTITNAQTKINLGGGYYGQTVTHPGLVLEYEIEKMFSEKVSLPLRFDMGFYNHPRNHMGIFLEANYGFRQYFKSGFFMEESIGAGMLQSILNSEDVFKVDDAGNISEGSRATTLDFMPSITFGLGYQMGEKSLIWLRPKLYWQYPHKTTSNYNFVLQLGYSFKLSSKSRIQND